MNSAMNLILSALVTLLWPSSVVTSGQGQLTNVKVLETDGCDLQCPSVEEREAVRNEIHQIANSAILIATGHIHFRNGTPGWRRVWCMLYVQTEY